ncbi:MAG: lipopolysaccharide/colanic/teichoic acid biosynthesis glycosyltransferase [Sediminicola sp.]|jgi:lipopolysaccharide/colanic/teichoic acid biosynthesis glycosyltransferase
MDIAIPEISTKLVKIDLVSSKHDDVTGYLFESALGRGMAWHIANSVGDLFDTNDHEAKNILLKTPLIKAYQPNQVFQSVWEKIGNEQLFAFKVKTAENNKLAYKDSLYPIGFKVIYPFHFLFRRVFPKLKGFRKVCRLLNIPVDLSKSEVLGRLIYCGFTIEKVIEQADETLFVAKKNTLLIPCKTTKESKEGFLFKMKRLGLNNKDIIIYKFRSMHPYAEYVQEFLHKETGLDSSGKFRDDFRVSTGGRVIRKYWIDELPMFINLFKGDIKLIGVRPISQHYFSLYPENLQTKRPKLKPGLLPPYYADLPTSFEEIVASELAYIAAYEQSPLKTDVKYFLRILNNILIKKARSK